MEVKYEHLRVNPGDRVKIRAMGIIAEGPVRSSYHSYVYESIDDEGAHNLIGFEPAGIEMSDDRDGGSYRYWKKGDGGTVEKLVGEEYVQVYPIHFEGEVSG